LLFIALLGTMSLRAKAKEFQIVSPTTDIL
jgi:hypothetical protein